jgi:hypothetical protein
MIVDEPTDHKLEAAIIQIRRMNGVADGCIDGVNGCQAAADKSREARLP